MDGLFNRWGQSPLLSCPEYPQTLYKINFDLFALVILSQELQTIDLIFFPISALV